MKLVTSEQMRRLEELSVAAGVSTKTLMENAGLAVAQEVWMALGTLEERRILVLVGPGNNGGDGLVAARHLHDWGTQVRCYLLRARGEGDANLRQVTVMVTYRPLTGVGQSPATKSATVTMLIAKR